MRQSNERNNAANNFWGSSYSSERADKIEFQPGCVRPWVRGHPSDFGPRLRVIRLCAGAALCLASFQRDAYVYRMPVCDILRRQENILLEECIR